MNDTLAHGKVKRFVPRKLPLTALLSILAVVEVAKLKLHMSQGHNVTTSQRRKLLLRDCLGRDCAEVTNRALGSGLWLALVVVGRRSRSGMRNSLQARGMVCRTSKDTRETGALTLVVH